MRRKELLLHVYTVILYNVRVLLQVLEYILDNLSTTSASAVIKCNYYLTRIVDDDLPTSIR